MDDTLERVGRHKIAVVEDPRFVSPKPTLAVRCGRGPSNDGSRVRCLRPPRAKVTSDELQDAVAALRREPRHQCPRGAAMKPQSVFDGYGGHGQDSRVKGLCDVLGQGRDVRGSVKHGILQCRPNGPANARDGYLRGRSDLMERNARAPSKGSPRRGMAESGHALSSREAAASSLRTPEVARLACWGRSQPVSPATKAVRTGIGMSGLWTHQSGMECRRRIHSLRATAGQQ